MFQAKVFLTANRELAIARHRGRAPEEREPVSSSQTTSNLEQKSWIILFPLPSPITPFYYDFRARLESLKIVGSRVTGIVEVESVVAPECVSVDCCFDSDHTRKICTHAEFIDAWASLEDSANYYRWYKFVFSVDANAQKTVDFKIWISQCAGSGLVITHGGHKNYRLEYV